MLVLLITGLVGLWLVVFGSATKASGHAGSSIVINELMYHPVSDMDGTEGEEYIELTNTGVLTVDLSGWWFSDGFDFTFPPGTLLPPGDYLVVAHDPQAVGRRYGLNPDELLGPFASGRLSNAGERVVLTNHVGELVDQVTYGDDAPWPEAADGKGASLALINPTFDNQQACYWAASWGAGTPGAENSVYAMDVAPCISNVMHAPVWPLSTQSVIVSARIQDNGVISSAVVYHKQDVAASFEPVFMRDDGSGADFVADDGIYTAELPRYGVSSEESRLVEFYVQATDDADLESRAPNGAPETFSQETGHPVSVSYLFLVQDVPPTSTRPLYQLLVTDRNWTELTTRDLYSNELLDATFVYGDQVYYNVGLRYRGESSRPLEPKSYRIEFPPARLFYADSTQAVGVEEMNLVGDHISREALTYDLFQRAGLLASDTEFVDLYVNGVYQALYLYIEQVEEPFLAAHLPGDDGGNLYRAVDGGDLSYRGEDPDSYRSYYLKKTNKRKDDYSDIVHLTSVLEHSSYEDFKEGAERVADMEQWVRWFAINALVFNQEGALFMGQGDDYFLYHRPSDDRFILIPWDHDSTFYYAQGDIWAPNLEMVKRILRYPPYTRMYYQNILALQANEFALVTMEPLIDALPAELEGDKEQLHQFVSGRHQYLDGYFAHALPDRSLAIYTNDGNSFATTERVAVLEGVCSPFRNVYVNGSDEGVSYPSIYDWRYVTPPLRPRANRLVFADRDVAGEVVTTRTITVTWDTFAGGRLTEDLALTREGSPYIILEDIVVPTSVTLTLEPGATLALAEGVSVFVKGRLVAEGTETEPITFTRDLDTDHWGVIGFQGSRADNRLAHVLVAYAGQDVYAEHTFEGVGAYDSRLTLEDAELVYADRAAMTLITSAVQMRRNWIHNSGTGLLAENGTVVLEDNRFHDLSVAGIRWTGESTDMVVYHNRIYDVLGDCISSAGGGGHIERNRVYGCVGAGLAISDTSSTVALSPTSKVTVTNNLVYYNDVGVVVGKGAAPYMSHNTLVSNTAGLMVSGIETRAKVANSVIWGSDLPISYTGGATVTVSYSDVQGGWPGEGNTNAAPRFRNPDYAIFRLLEDSPCIDQAASRYGVGVDLLGVPRPRGEAYDMGAHEFFEFYQVYLPSVSKP
jgi:spore coat protein H